MLYKTYWYSLINKKDNINNSEIYFSAQPNKGAGIGHQIANWIAGYWFAEQFDVKFAHLSFSTKKWDDFLGFGENEKKIEELLNKGYKKRRIPLFDEKNEAEKKLIENIINSYYKKKVVFVCEQDQFYRDQYGVIDKLKSGFFNAKSRKGQKLVYDKNYTNIAIHVRRGDILNDPSNPNLQMRYISNEYFIKVLEEVVEKVKTEKPIQIYFFSQGKPEDFDEFKGFNNLNWCLDMGAQDSFLHMVYADVLITSKSSFSYKPALLNQGIKVCPEKFWHGYPQTEDWIMADDLGNIKVSNIIV